MGNLSTPKSVQKLQKALHAKAKAEAGYRFYALYDKISREDILAHAYAQCRSNKGAPGVDGQNFADIDAFRSGDLCRKRVCPHDKGLRAGRGYYHHSKFRSHRLLRSNSGRKRFTHRNGCAASSI